MIRQLPAEELFDLVRRVTAAGGNIPVRVAGLSMYPAIEPGATVVLGPLAGNPQPGQVVLARRGKRVFLHRLVRQQGTLMLRGDHPHSPLWSLEHVELAGRVTRVERSCRAWLRWLVWRWLDWLTRPAAATPARS